MDGDKGSSPYRGNQKPEVDLHESRSDDLETHNGAGGLDTKVYGETDVFAASGPGQVDFKGLTWPHAGVIIAKLQIGIGLLGIPGTFATLGFVPGLISLIILSAFTTYGGILSGHIRILHPEIHSPTELGRILCGGNAIAAEVFGFFYWVLLVMVAGSGLLTTSIALNAVSLHAICTMGWVGVAAGVALIVGTSCRQLTKVAWIGWIGIASVVISIFTLVIAMLTESFPLTEFGQTGEVEVLAVNTEATFAEAMSAIVTQLFALLGNIAFFGVAAEMKRPQDFTRAVLAGQGFIIGMYFVIGIIVYAKAGQFLTSPALASAGELFKRICYGLAIPAVLITSIMYTHMAAKLIFVRALRGTRHLTVGSTVHWGTWIASNIGCLALSFILAASIPIFDSLLSLIGATVGALFAVMMVGFTALYLIAHEDEAKAAMRGVKSSEVDTSSGLSRSSWLKRSYTFTWGHPTSTWKRKATFIWAVILIVCGLFLLGGGTYGSVEGIISAYATGSIKSAFSCDDNSVTSA